MRANLVQGPALTAAMLGMIALLVAGCASQGDTGVVACPETRPQVCTLEYAPTCGVNEAGQWQQFASPCNACASDGIVGYQSGPCPE